jgi:site-specific DNA-methyltransferase (adenine-specific)
MTLKWISEKRKLKDLKDYDNNPRKMGKEEFGKLVDSLMSDGYHQRLLINQDGTIIGGHARKKALLKSGYKENDEIDVLVPDRLLEGDDFDRINIRDNLPYGAFDFDMLANLFDPSQLIEWGMPTDWLQLVEEDMEIEVEESDNEIPEIPDEPTTKLGDIWLLGEHRLMCGDSVAITDVERLIDGNIVDMVYTDPPYGVNIVKNNKIGGGKIAKCNTYAKIIGDDSTQTAVDSYNLCSTLNISILVFWGGNYYASALPNSQGWIVWDKENTGDFADCELAWTNQDRATRIFKHMWNGMIKASEHDQKRVHPTQKPIELALWCLKEYGKDAKTILDLFGGSGSTLMACEKSKRKCFMMELSPHYCDVIIARWEKLTGEKAKLTNQ